jgi:GDPmannose 4,6-dehydratase
MKTAIITGITGQDGAYLSKFLIQKNYKVIGITRSYKNGSNINLKYLSIEKDIIIEQIDLLDFSNVIGLINKYNPTEIYNLSAQSSVGVSFLQPIGTIQYNIITVLNLLEAIRISKKLIKFYQASSSEMFGRVNNLPITLNTPMHPVSPYGISKASAYWTTINYRESYNIFASNGILFNHESYLRPENFFIKKVIQQSIKISFNLSNSLTVGNIDIKRDFGFAPKYVEAMWLALQQPKADDFIICSGQSISLREIIYHIFERLNISKDKLVEDKELFRPNEISDIYGDNTYAKENLGWEYKDSFFDILDHLIEEEQSSFTFL